MPHEQTIPTEAPIIYHSAVDAWAAQTQRTHWEGCYRDPGHHACALAEIERLKALAATQTNFPNGVEIPADLC